VGVVSMLGENKNLNIDSRSYCFFNSNAGQLMEEFIEKGIYKHMKTLSNESDFINKNIYHHLIQSEVKRHEIGNHLVAKFIPKKIFHYDYPGLNEYLFDRGLLQKLTKLSSTDINRKQEILDIFKPLSLNSNFYIKPTFNKAGREFVKGEEYLDLQLPLKEASKRKRANFMRLKTVKMEYETLKKKMGICQQLITEGKVNHKYGSVSRIQKPLIYQTSNVTDSFMIETLIKYGKPDMNKIMFYCSKGFFPKSEIESFRKLIDIKLSFVILDLDDEARMMNFL
jgi:hypothetical protein